MIAQLDYDSPDNPGQDNSFWDRSGCRKNKMAAWSRLKIPPRKFQIHNNVFEQSGAKVDPKSWKISFFAFSSIDQSDTVAPIWLVFGDFVEVMPDNKCACFERSSPSQFWETGGESWPNLSEKTFFYVHVAAMTCSCKSWAKMAGKTGFLDFSPPSVQFCMLS